MPADPDPTPEDTELKLLEILDRNDLRRPDEVIYDPVADELVCRWTDEQLTVVVEMSDPPLTS